jgi:EmrB/QacA subfamily drug resistance transporter
MSSSSPHRYAVMAVVLAAVLMSVLDGIVVGIALPTITASFGTSVAVSQWTITVYLLIITALLLVFGRISEKTGRPALFIAGLAVFTLASLACGLSHGIAMLIAFRAVQAVGGAMTFSISGAILYAAFPPQERGRAMGFLGSTVAVGSILGPVLGGLLVDSLGWPFIFFINVPIGAVLIAAAVPLLGRSEQRPSAVLNPPAAARMDWPGAGALAVSLTALTLCLGAAARGAAPAVVLAAAAVCVLAGAGFIWWEKRAVEPLLDLRFFRNRAFTRPVIGMMLAFISSFMLNISGPFYFQGVMGYTASQVGLVFLVVPVVTVIASPVSGWLFDKRYWKHYGRLGMGLVALCLLALGWMALRIDFRPMIPLFAVLGMGSALFQSPNSTEIMNAFPREKAGIASSITATVRNLGMTIGTAVGTLVISAQLAGAGYAGSILQADKPLLARVLGVTILASGAAAAAASLSL